MRTQLAKVSQGDPVFHLWSGLVTGQYVTTCKMTSLYVQWLQCMTSLYVQWLQCMTHWLKANCNKFSLFGIKHTTEYSYAPGFLEKCEKNSCCCLKDYVNILIKPAENQLGHLGGDIKTGRQTTIFRFVNLRCHCNHGCVDIVNWFCLLTLRCH